MDANTSGRRYQDANAATWKQQRKRHCNFGYPRLGEKQANGMNLQISRVTCGFDEHHASTGCLAFNVHGRMINLNAISWKMHA